ncbi:hypothetical protein EMIT053CA3_80191 [Pseudomonas donghuensis]
MGCRPPGARVWAWEAWNDSKLLEKAHSSTNSIQVFMTAWSSLRFRLYILAACRKGLRLLKDVVRKRR